MKLNLHILADELQEYGGELICSADVHSSLAGVRLVEPASAALREEYLYLADAETLSRLPAGGRLSFACSGSVDRSVFENRGWSALLLPGAIDRNELFRKVQEVFERYAQWEQDMLLAIANHAPLQTIFDIGVRFLHNPIALFDISQAYIAMAGALPANIENTIWEEVLSQRYTKIENLPSDEQRAMARALAERDEPFFYRNTVKYRQHQQMIASLKHNGKPFATLGSIDIVRPFTLGQLSILAHLKAFLELALKNDRDLAGVVEGSSYFVDRLLQGFAVERNAVEYHLSKKRWRIEDEYCVLFFTRSDRSPIDANLNEMYAFRFRSMLGDVMIFPYENGSVAISRQNERIRSDAAFAGELARLLEQLDLRCGVSLAFQDFMSLKYAYIQCKTALAAEPGDGPEWLCMFETRYSEHVLNALDVSTSLKSLCHPKILKLHQSEGEKGREFIQSLQAYLINGRNATAAANALFIHRNTLLYRLKRIEELLGMDLEAADEQALFLLYLSCLIAQHPDAGGATGRLGAA